MDLTDIYQTFYPKEAKYTFFSNAHGIFSKIDHLIGHKMRLNKFKKSETISNIFTGNMGLKLEAKPKGKTQNIQIHAYSITFYLTMNGVIMRYRKK